MYSTATCCPYGHAWQFLRRKYAYGACRLLSYLPGLFVTIRLYYRSRFVIYIEKDRDTRGRGQELASYLHAEEEPTRKLSNGADEIFSETSQSAILLGDHGDQS